MAADQVLRVEVAYATTGEQTVIALAVASGTTVSQALALSGIAQRYSEIEAAQPRVGIYGKVVAADTVLCDGDRVEVYRPLIADPKQARRRRAAERP